MSGGFGKYTSPKATVEDKTIKKKIEYQKINPDAKFGRNIAIIAPATFGKSLFATSFGFFNSKYVNKLDKELFPYSIRLLKEGHMP